MFAIEKAAAQIDSACQNVQPLAQRSVLTYTKKPLPQTTVITKSHRLTVIVKSEGGQLDFQRG